MLFLWRREALNAHFDPARVALSGWLAGQAFPPNSTEIFHDRVGELSPGALPLCPRARQASRGCHLQNQDYTERQRDREIGF